MTVDRDVVIVGGGFAGLSAGVALAERGYLVTVIEKRSRLGGRASSYVDPTTGEVVDNGQHVFLRAYRQTIRFLATIGTLDQLVFQRRFALDLVGPEGSPTHVSAFPLPAPLHVAAGVLAARGLPLRDRLAALSLGWRVWSRDDADARLMGRVHVLLDNRSDLPRLEGMQVERAFDGDVVGVAVVSHASLSPKP